MGQLNRFLAPYPIAVRAPLDFETAAIMAEVRPFPEEWWQVHEGPYHNGGWESVSLWAQGGDRTNQRSRGAGFAATEALERTPALQVAIDRFPGERNRVRLMRLRPGGIIRRHSDPMEEIDPNLVRLHVPLQTNDRVTFTVADRVVRMREGETWRVDVRFPHAVRNDGASDRIHLVVDLLISPELDDLLSAGDPVGHGRLTGYFIRQSIPRRIRLKLGLAN
ncbi:MAG: aspartyl/asparaginyl beta-hydroxylase domain-containing protein [Acidobacteria bacterium]|nr:aspartyl/asparaginyl beta-hydroxylase domain-containing protein [Acidobacteriota bacterium]